MLCPPPLPCPPAPARSALAASRAHRHAMQRVGATRRWLSPGGCRCWLSCCRMPGRAQTILDMAWAPDAYTLLCCSKDGSVAVFSFSPEEIGTPLSQARSLLA